MASQVEALKILITGNVNGNMSHLLERVASLSKKTKFDALIIVGCLFTPTDSPSDIQWMDEVASYFPKYKTLPDDIYIVSPNSKNISNQVLALYRKLITLGKTDELSTEQIDSLLDSGTDVLSGRMTLLGSRGVFDCSSGLKIAYFAGDESTGITDADLEAFNLTLSSSTSTFESTCNCDIFLTTSWPAGVTLNTTVPIAPDVSSYAANNCSIVIAKAVSLIQPRYHFTCSNALYYERQPYRNHQVLAEKMRPVTRFISLADVPVKMTAKKSSSPKWLYAFNLKPTHKLLQLDKESGTNEGRKELITQPSDTTESPFASMDLSIALKKSSNTNQVDNGQFFYQMPQKKIPPGNKRPYDQQHHQRDNEGNVHHHHTRGDKEPRRNEPLDSSNCWFCLSSPNVEKEYIISIGDNCYLALAKGGLVEDHVLILPIDHIRSSLEASDELQDEIAKFKAALTKFYAANGNDVAFFERNFKSQHMQIQAVPIPCEYLQEDKEHLEKLKCDERNKEQPTQQQLQEEEEKEKDVDDYNDNDNEQQQPRPSKSDDDASNRKRAGPIVQLVKGIINSHALRYRLINKDSPLKSHIDKLLPYFHIEIPAISLNAFVIINTKKKDSHGNTIRFPLQIGREILAHVLRLDEHTVDWRIVTTTLTKNQEAARTINFRKRFEPFDFTVEA